MNAVSRVRRAAERTAAEPETLGGTHGEPDIVCGIREYKRLIERTLAGEHDRCNGDHDRKYDQKFD
jgi:hypothetical protein